MRRSITQNNNKIGLFEIPFMIIACSFSRLGGETIDFLLIKFSKIVYKIEDQLKYFQVINYILCISCTLILKKSIQSIIEEVIRIETIHVILPFTLKASQKLLYL